MSNAPIDISGVRMAALSQIAYLNPPSTWKPEYSLLELIAYWEKDPEIPNHKQYSVSAFNIIKNDPYFKDMMIAEFENDKKSGMQAYCFTRQNPPYINDEAIFAFRGTEGADWNDAIWGSVDGDDPQKAAAVEFVERMARKKKNEGGYSSITTTGHSLGGKLAEHAAVHSNADNIKKSVVFNPKNFKEKTVTNNENKKAGKEMTRYVTYDKNGKFVGGFWVKVGDVKIGGDWCKDNEKLNYGTAVPIDGNGHNIKDVLKNAWNGGKYKDNFPNYNPSPVSQRRPVKLPIPLIPIPLILWWIAKFMSGIFKNLFPVGATSKTTSGSGSTNIKINVNGVVNSKPSITTAKSKITSAKNGTSDLKKQIDSKIRGRNNIDGRMNTLVNLLGTIESRIGSISLTVENGALKYQTTDNDIYANSRKLAK